MSVIVRKFSHAIARWLPLAAVGCRWLAFGRNAFFTLIGDSLR